MAAGAVPGPAEDRAELLAHHWQAALQFTRAAAQDTSGLAEPARLALRDAGDRALELNAFAAAAGWYSAALELWPAADPDRARLLLRLGRARYFAEQAGAELFAEARDGLLSQGDREGAAEAEDLLGGLLATQGLWQPALAHRRQAVALLEDEPPSPAKAAALTGLGGSLMVNGEFEEAIQVGRQALAMARALGLDEQQAQALNFIGCARIERGDRGGLEDLEQAVAIAVQANSPDSAAAYGNLATFVVALGDLARGFQLQVTAQEAAARFGLASALRHARAEQTFQDYWQGRWDAALAGADQFIAEVEAGSPHYMERACRQVRGLIRLARGDLPGALADAASAVELARQLNNPDALLPALAFHARVLLANGQAEQVGAWVDELLAGLAERGALATNPDWSGELAIVLHALGRAAELTELTADVSAPTPWLQASTAMAADDFGQAADIYAEIGSLPDQAYARLRAAEQLLAAGRRADGHAQLQQARGFCRQVRATAYLRQVDALVAASA